MAKVIVNTTDQLSRAAAFDDYDRRICLVRDPRDLMISGVLYAWYAPMPALEDYAGFIRLLQEKERDPGSVGFLDLAAMTRKRDSYADAASTAPTIAAELQHRGWLLFRYEEMVEGRFSALERYLGFPVRPAAEVPRSYRRVVRSKGAGNWRHWLTPKDVELLRPRLAPALEALDYGNDWTLADPQILNPATGSDYVRSLRGNPVQRLHRIARRFARHISP